MIGVEGPGSGKASATEEFESRGIHAIGFAEEGSERGGRARGAGSSKRLAEAVERRAGSGVVGIVASERAIVPGKGIESESDRGIENDRARKLEDIKDLGWIASARVHYEIENRHAIDCGNRRTCKIGAIRRSAARRKRQSANEMPGPLLEAPLSLRTPGPAKVEKAEIRKIATSEQMDLYVRI